MPVVQDVGVYIEYSFIGFSKNDSRRYTLTVREGEITDEVVDKIYSVNSGYTLRQKKNKFSLTVFRG